MKKIFIFAILALIFPFSMMMSGCFGNKSYDITTQQLSNCSISCSYSEAKQGEEITLYYDNLAAGYEFAYFTINGEKINDDTFTMPNKDVVVSAVLSKIQYTITYHIDSDTTFEDENSKIDNYTIETSADLPEITKNGYFFEGWFTDEELQNEIRVIASDMYGNLDLYPKFIIKNYSIKYHYEGQVTHNNPSSYNVESETIILTDATKQDYEFKGWYDNKTFTGNKITSIPADSAKTINLYAKFISTKVDNEGYRLITNAIDFMEIIPTNLDGKYKITGTIDLKNLGYSPIGDEDAPFTGEIVASASNTGFVENVSISSMDEYAGLFGYIKNATITGLSLIDFDIQIPTNRGTMEHIGALAGYAENCTIDDVYVAYADIEVNVWSAFVGSMVGLAKNSTISNCETNYCPITVTANQEIYSGQLCGSAYNSTISKCSATFLSSTNIIIEAGQQNSTIYCGGLVGECYESSIDNSYIWQEDSRITTQLKGRSSTSYVGGLVGYLRYSSSITNCYALLNSISSHDAWDHTDPVDMSLGGLVGKTYSNSSIRNSFLTTDKSNTSYNVGLHCIGYMGYIVASTDDDSLVTNNYVDNQIVVSNFHSEISDEDNVTMASQSSIKTSLNWDTTIWDINWLGANVAPILK